MENVRSCARKSLFEVDNEASSGTETERMRNGEKRGWIREELNHSEGFYLAKERRTTVVRENE